MKFYTVYTCGTPFADPQYKQRRTQTTRKLTNIQARQNVKSDPVELAKLALEDRKGHDITVLDLRGKNSYTDFIIICTGTSERHVQSLAENVADFLQKGGHVIDSIEGTPHNNWVIADAGDVVVHVFVKEARELYKLEKLYSFNDDDNDDTDSNLLKKQGN